MLRMLNLCWRGVFADAKHERAALLEGDVGRAFVQMLGVAGWQWRAGCRRLQGMTDHGVGGIGAVATLAPYRVCLRWMFCGKVAEQLGDQALGL